MLYSPYCALFRHLCSMSRRRRASLRPQLSHTQLIMGLSPRFRCVSHHSVIPRSEHELFSTCPIIPLVSSRFRSLQRAQTTPSPSCVQMEFDGCARKLWLRSRRFVDSPRRIMHLSSFLSFSNATFNLCCIRSSSSICRQSMQFLRFQTLITSCLSFSGASAMTSQRCGSGLKI